MPEADNSFDQDDADELLRRALLDEGSAVTVSLRIDGLPVSEAVTVIFYARRDLGTLQTYLTPGSLRRRFEGRLSDLLRVPCDLDLADAEDREEAQRLYAEQARILRDASSAPTSSSASGVSRLPSSPGRSSRSTRSTAGPPADAATAADRARRARCADVRDARLQRPDARRGPAAARDRLRPAGLTPDLPAGR